MYITVTTSNDMDFDDIYQNSWSGAVDTLNTVLDEGKEDDLMELLDELYPDGVDENDLNDFLWFDDDYIFNELGINLEEEGEEE
jgi:hypothetical protein